MQRLKIVYVGSLDNTSNSYRRFKTLSELGHTMHGVDIEGPIYQSVFSKFHYRLNIGPGIYFLNKKISQAVKEVKPDLLLIDNKSFVQPRTLKNIRKFQPRIKIVNLITDDPTGHARVAWRLCLSTASLFDCHFVQRKVNVNELKAVGARRVELCYRSYDPAFHRPVQLQGGDIETYTCEVGFVGTYEHVRESFVAHLIQNGIPVSVTGDGWPGGKLWDIIKPYYRGVSVYGDAYIKTLNGMKIALHFLRHGNRDEQDSRTFEIPACGTFMLAEASELHLSLFENGKDAVFFESKEELLQLTKYYLQHDEERARIAACGRERGIRSGYDHASRLKVVLNTVFDNSN